MCIEAHNPDVSICFPLLSDSGLHKYYMRLSLLSPHTRMQHQTSRPTYSLPGQGRFHPAHPRSTESLAILTYNKHTYFRSLSGDAEPCIVLERQPQFVQSKLCSDAAATPTCPSLWANPTVWAP